MLLALAVLLVQPTPSLAGLPLTGLHSQAAPAYVDDKTDKTPAAAPAKDEKAAQKAPSSAPVFPAPVKDEKAGASGNGQIGEIGYQPGQIDLTRVSPLAANSANGNAAGGESSSREISGPAVPGASAPASFKPTPYSPVREAGRLHGLPRKWLILGAVEHGAATFDAYSTRQVITSGTGYEMNPMLRPFANSGALYGAVQVAPLAFDYLSLRMLHSSHPWMRKMWWMPQSLSAGASMFGGIHNSLMH
ncbi:MAG: hypothetical protein WAM91_00285 [Candidatus Acidiferrales bacterium]